MSTQEEENELAHLSSQTVLQAIDAVKRRAWDINPFTVADELKVPRSLIYRHAEAMKLIIAARGGDFGMDVQTSLDLTWQLRKLEQEYDELKRKLASNHPEHPVKDYSEAILDLEEPNKNDTKKVEEVIFNLAGNEPYMNDYSEQLANISWKELETIYHFRGASLKDEVASLFDNGSESHEAVSERVVNLGLEQGSTSLPATQLLKSTINKRRQNSISPFARLKSNSSKTASLPENELEDKLLLDDNKQTRQKAVLPSEQPFIAAEIQAPREISSEKSQAQETTTLSNQLALQIRSKLESKPAIVPDSETQAKGSQGDNGTLGLPESSVQVSYEAKSELNTSDLKPVAEPVEASNEVLAETPAAVETLNSEGIEKELIISGDELRGLIQSHIKNAAEQMADIHSIGTGKEFEVWLNNPARSKFVGSTKAVEVAEDIGSPNTSVSPNTGSFTPRVVPPEVRKSCLILGIRMDNISYDIVQEAWKKTITAPGVHPDQGGDTELAIYLNTAKDILIRWLDAQAPKLGKKFGPYKQEKNAPSQKDKNQKDKNKD